MKDRFIEHQVSIEALVVMYELYGKAHEIHAGRIDREFQENEKPLVATRGNSC